MKKKFSIRKKFFITLAIVCILILSFIIKNFSMIGEYISLASLGGIVKATDSQVYYGKETHIDFGKDSQQHILIIEPPANVQKQNKAVFFAYGGGWKMGSPEQYKFVGRYFAKMGYTTILAGYRLAPDYQYPVQNEDIVNSFKTGMNFLTENGIVVNGVILGGHSAGAQLVSLMAMDKRWLGKDISLVSGLFSVSGPLDFSHCQEGSIKGLIDGYIGKGNDSSAANPITYATTNTDFPVLCLHGSRDPVVDPECSEAFVAKVNGENNKTATLYISEKRYHSDMLQLFYKQTEETKVLNDWLKTIK